MLTINAEDTRTGSIQEVQFSDDSPSLLQHPYLNLVIDSTEAHGFLEWLTQPGRRLLAATLYGSSTLLQQLYFRLARARIDAAKLQERVDELQRRLAERDVRDEVLWLAPANQVSHEEVMKILPTAVPLTLPNGRRLSVPRGRLNALALQQVLNGRALDCRVGCSRFK